MDKNSEVLWAKRADYGFINLYRITELIHTQKKNAKTIN